MMIMMMMVMMMMITLIISVTIIIMIVIIIIKYAYFHKFQNERFSFHSFICLRGIVDERSIGIQGRNIHVTFQEQLNELTDVFMNTFYFII